MTGRSRLAYQGRAVAVDTAHCFGGQMKTTYQIKIRNKRTGKVTLCPQKFSNYVLVTTCARELELKNPVCAYDVVAVKREGK